MRKVRESNKMEDERKRMEGKEGVCVCVGGGGGGRDRQIEEREGGKEGRRRGGKWKGGDRGKREGRKGKRVEKNNLVSFIGCQMT